MDRVGLHSWGRNLHFDLLAVFLVLGLSLTAISGCIFDRSGLTPTSSNNHADAGHDVVTPDGGCQEGELRCVDDNVEQCQSGTWVFQEHCRFRCKESSDGCARFYPTNGIDPDWLSTGRSPFEPDSDVLINTENNSIDPDAFDPVVYLLPSYYCSSAHHPMETVVFVFSSIAIPENVTVRIIGSRAVALAAAGPVVIRGKIELKGGRAACPSYMPPQPWCAGPGGYRGGYGAVADPEHGHGPGGGGPGYGSYTQDETGGGGAGHGGAGGAGGNENDGNHNPGGTEGLVYGNAVISPLCGGSGGGGGGGGAGSSDSSHGGGGGGAIQVVSAELVEISCSTAPCGILASGGGGQADHNPMYDDGGGGGGSGGAILIEAPQVNLGENGVLAAGGGGGAGGSNAGSDCNDGDDGSWSPALARGGIGTFSGGPGGGGTIPDGSPGQEGGDGTGAGGGGAGRIRINHFEPLELLGTTNPEWGTDLCTRGDVHLE